MLKTIDNNIFPYYNDRYKSDIFDLFAEDCTGYTIPVKQECANIPDQTD